MWFINFRNKWQRRLFLIFYGFFLAWMSFNYNQAFVAAMSFVVSYVIGLISGHYFKAFINGIIVLLSIVFYISFISVVNGFGANGDLLPFNILFQNITSSFIYASTTMNSWIVGIPAGLFSRWAMIKIKSKH